MARRKVADLLVEVLTKEGVRQIYGVSGDSLNGITDSIRATKQIQWIPPPSPPARKLILRGGLPFAPEVAARALAENSPALKDSSASLLPPLSEIRRVAEQIAIAIGLEAQKGRVAPNL
jgi:hypothetical protein